MGLQSKYLFQHWCFFGCSLSTVNLLECISMKNQECKIQCTENHIFFFVTSWKDDLSKEIALEYDLSCIIAKDDFSFSRKYDLTLWTENEKWFFSKKHMEIWYFVRVFWNDNLSKKTALEHDLPCIIWTDSTCFPGDTIFFLCLENTRRHDIFCVYVQAL